MLRSVRLSSLDSEDLGHQGGRGDRRANHRPHLTFSTDDPGGVRPRSSWPHSHQQGGWGCTRACFALARSPLVAAPSPHTRPGPRAEEPSHDLASRPPGSRPRGRGCLEPVLSKDAAVGGRRRGRWPVGACRAPRPPPPFQVPSASRRGGLKTPGGGCRPSALGSGRSGPRGGVVGRSLPSPRRLRRPPRGRGGARRGAPRSLPPRPSGGGYPTAVVWAVAVCGGACARSPASPGEGGNPPGACGVCPSTPWRVGAGRPVV